MLEVLKSLIEEKEEVIKKENENVRYRTSYELAEYNKVQGEIRILKYLLNILNY